MDSRLRGLLGLALFTISAALTAGAPSQSSSPTKAITPSQRAELFSYLDRLGYAKTLSGPIFYQSYPGYAGDEDRLIGWDFVLRARGLENGSRYVHFNLRRFAPYDEREKPMKRFPYEAAVDRALDGCKGLPIRIFSPYQGLMQPTILDAVTWARYADLRHDTRRRDLFLEAASRFNLGKPVLPEVVRQAGFSEFWTILTDFGDARISWDKHKASLRMWCSRFPSHPERRYAQRLVEAVEETIRLDRRRPTDHIGRLIEKLAHTSDVEWNRDSMTDTADPGTYPFIDLMRLGHKAVPRLIQALDDRRLCHELRERAFYVDSLNIVYRVQTLVLEILESIAGRRFKPRFETLPQSEEDLAHWYESTVPFSDQDAWIKQAKSNVHRWWKVEKAKLRQR